MANIKISDLPLIANITPSSGEFPIVYNNVTYKMNWSQLNNQITASGANPLNITGTGTTGNITKWTTGGSVLGDSLIADNGSTITMSGNITIPNSGTIGSVSTNDAITIKSGGQVGIKGTPVYDFHVFGSIMSIQGPTATLRLYGTGLLMLFDLISSNGYFSIREVNNGRNVYLADPRVNGWQRWYINGIQKMHLDSEGNLGIGTTSPNYKLDVQIGSGSSNGVGFINGGGKGLEIYTDSNASNADVYINQTSSDLASLFYQLNGSTKLTIASTGLTQINSTSTTALELITNQSASSLRLKNTGSIVADWIMQSGGINAGDLSFYNLDTSAYRLTITSGGNVGIGTTTPSFATIDSYAQRGIEITGTKETGTAPVIRLSETGSGKGLQEIRSQREGSGNYLSFGEAADTFMVIRSDDDGGGVTTRGNVGIGTTSPNEKLSVRGAANVDAFIHVGGGSGTTKGGLKLGHTANTYCELLFDNANNNVTLLQKYVSGSLILGTNSTPNLTIASGGNATFSGQVLSNSDFKAQGAYPSLALDSTSYSKFSLVNRYSTNRMSFDTTPQGGTNIEAAYLNNNGRFDFNYGIAFPNQSSGSGTVASSTLDAYEEGTWTPTLLNANGNENTAGTYTRIGNIVRVGGVIVFNSQSNTTQFTIQSFPFQVGTVNEGTRGGVSVAYSTSSIYYTILMDDGLSQARVWGQGATGNPTLAGLSGTRVYFGGTYQI